MQTNITAEKVIAAMLDFVIHPNPESFAEMGELWKRMNPAEEKRAMEVADALIQLQKACESLARRDQEAGKHLPPSRRLQ